MNVAVALVPPTIPLAPRVPIGSIIEGRVGGSGELEVDLERLMAGRMLIQGSSGAGKSRLLRRLIEEAFEYTTTMIVDPEGEFGNLAEHIGATSLRAVDMSAEGLTAAAVRGRRHRLALHVDLSDLGPDQRIIKAAAFFTGLVDCPREDWANTILVAVDEAHLLAPHVAASSRDAETRRLGVAALTDLNSRGRKRGVAPVLATQRLAKLATSVASELQNVCIGLNIFDRDVARAADLLGFTGARAAQLRDLKPGQFFALGPALSNRPVLAHIGETSTAHLGATPDLLGPSGATLDEASALLDLGDMLEAGTSRSDGVALRGGRMLDAFLLDAAAAPAVRIIVSLRSIAPNATTSAELARHLGVSIEEIDAGLDLLAHLGAADTMPKADDRIARLSSRLRLRGAGAQVMGLA